MSSGELLPLRSLSTPQALISPEEGRVQSLLQPDLFAEVYLQTELWSKQRQILQALPTKPRIVVKACHSSSKTFTAAIAVLWFLSRYKKATVVTTAPTWGQVERLLWGEVHAAIARSRFGAMLRADKNIQILKTEIRIEPKREAYGLSTSVTNQDEGVKFQGIHNENVLMILDEAPGVDPKIWGAIEGNRSGGNVRILAIGNPTITSGPFHDAFTRNRATWYPITISAFDTPNFDFIPKDWSTDDKIEYLIKNVSEEDLDNNPRPYLTTRRWVKERYYEWGEGHPLWEARVLGDFPKQSEDSLISLTWLERAGRSELPGEGKVCAGIDVAGPGESETVLCVRKGPKILLQKEWPISDPRGDIVSALNEYKNDLDVVNVDAVGIGWYLYKHLEELKFPAYPFIAQAPSNDNEKYRTAKDEAYWGLRQRLEDGNLSGLTDDVTIGQLAGIRYKHNSRGQVEIESKDKAIDRGVPSPDRAEAVMLAFAGQNLVFGVNEAYKQEVQKESMQKVQVASGLAKPEIADNPLSCEKCKSKCITRYQTGWRCGQCAHQWGSKKTDLQKPPNRTDMLLKASQRSIRLDD